MWGREGVERERERKGGRERTGVTGIGEAGVGSETGEGRRTCGKSAVTGRVPRWRVGENVDRLRGKA